MLWLVDASFSNAVTNPHADFGSSSTSASQCLGNIWQRLVFADLLVGDYTVTASATGYLSDFTAVKLADDTVTEISLFPIPGPVIPEYPLGTILGLVMCMAALAVFKSKRLHIHP